MTKNAANQIEDQIVYGKLAALNRHAGDRLQRISRSPLIAEDRMFAAGVLTARLELAHQLQYEPEHLYALRASVRHAFDRFAYDIAEGDVILTADPYGGGTKGQSLTLVVPTFVDGELALSPAIRAQMTDLGGEIPGGFNPVAYELWQESVRITPVKLFAGGKLQRDVLRFLTTNSRTSEWFGDDLEALHACCRESQRSILELIHEYGMEKVNRSVSSMLAYARSEALRALPDASEAAALPGKADLPFEGADLEIRVRAYRDEDRFVFDFADSPAQRHSPYNCTRETAQSFAVSAALAHLLDDLPLNDGLLESFRFELPPGSIICPEFPAATALGGSYTGHAVAAAVTDALNAGNSDGAYPGIHGTGPWAMLYPPVGSERVVPMRVDPGFASAGDGWGPAGLSGSGRLMSAEELEARYGFRMERRERLEGNDRGMEVRLRVLDGEWEYKLFSPEEGELSIHAADASAAPSGKRTLKPGDVIDFRYKGPGPLERKGGTRDED
ncbi:hydantoinase B/oxoprolinase family protein [Cohnella nanjingensis]|uniref:Hydantoinase B/oxoprolinase family protein n=1 Tax=Cohnella nanjingensis TaxID=1387779 RepID=A0A7X0RXV8_9BACL|nr:hydantoinase B/oxoprolinase family protein [Cohnella nanjingensis]MBB6675663.1 hydantoinase B/oxoprolinase family protein [Cohnella nanjingensis]